MSRKKVNSYIRRQQREGAKTQVEVTKLRAEGLTQIAVAAELGIHRHTVAKFEKRSMENLLQHDAEQRLLWREEHVRELESLRVEIESRRKASQPLSLTSIDRMLAILRLDISLKGTDAPSRSIVGHLSGNLGSTNPTNERYLDLMKYCCDLTDPQLEEVVKFAKSLSREWQDPEYIRKKFENLPGINGNPLFPLKPVIEGTAKQIEAPATEGKNV